MGGRPIPTASGVLFERRVKETAGRGRACLRVWPQLHIGTVIKHSVKKQVTHITRQISHGMLEQANALLKRSQGGTMLNAAMPRVGSLPYIQVCICLAVATISVGRITN